jgi:hypothetical protein
MTGSAASAAQPDRRQVTMRPGQGSQCPDLASVLTLTVGGYLGAAPQHVHQRSETWSLERQEHAGESWELRTGDFREVLADLADQSVDAVVTDPPYNNDGVPLYEPLGTFALRVLKPGRLAVVYAGHLQLDREMELLARGGLTYMWHGANMLRGRHTRVRVRMVFGQHRSVLLYSAGPYRPRTWLNDVAFAEGRGGPEERPLHPWQQALEPVRHWVRQVSEPGELIVDPFLGSGTTAVAVVMEGRRFIGCDIDPGCVETTRRRVVELAEGSETDKAES